MPQTSDGFIQTETIGEMRHPIAPTVAEGRKSSVRVNDKEQVRESGGFSSLVLLLFASGSAALVYQILWVKQLSLIVGVDVYAITTGVSAFFAGLGLGGYIFGRWADRIDRPLILYALLELSSAALGIAGTVALSHTAPLFALGEARIGLGIWALPFFLVGIPAFVMGGTLPTLVRTLRPGSGRLGSAGGGLYAANTAGAIAGALVSSFVLIPSFGVQGSASVAAGLNLICALGALALNRSSVSRGPFTSFSDTPQLTRDARLAVILYMFAGAIALGYEVVWSQAIVQFLSTRSFAFAILLATYLGGLAAGSALYARRADRVREPWGIFGLLIAAAGLLALLPIALLGNWLMNWQSIIEGTLRSATGNELLAMCGRFAVAALIMIFPATLLLGAAFPAALRLADADARHTGRNVGIVVGLNTVGGIVGTMLAGFVLIPTLGLIGTLGLLAVSSAGLGIYAAISGRGVQPFARWAIFAVSAASVLVTVLTPKDRLAQLLPRTRSGGEIAFYDESPGGTVAVVEQRVGKRSNRRLYIQGVSNSGDSMTSLRYMRLQALLPLLIHNGHPRSALVIGFGTGITAGTLLTYSGLERRVCAELLPPVIRAAPLFNGNLGAGSDKRLEVRLRDGRRELLQNPQQYDLITLEPPPPSAAGVVNLYSMDFYRLAVQRLRPEGILAQWWPLATQNDEDSRSIVRSFLDSFPYVSLWTTEIHEMLLVGSLQPTRLDVPRISGRFEQPLISAALAEVGIASPAALLATWVTGREGLERYAGNAQAVTDDRPTIEYATWVRRGEIMRVLPEILALRTDPPLGGTNDAFRAQVEQERRNLLSFYEAALDAYKGDREAWAQDLGAVMEADPGNPYYLWIAGGAATGGR
jgi:predicted membrane-bound spermidine synthase